MIEMNNGNNQLIDNKSFVGRAALWAFVVGRLGLRGSKLAGWAILGPIGEKVFSLTLEELLIEAERQRRQQQAQRRMKRLLRSTATSTEKTIVQNKPQARAEFVSITIPDKQVTEKEDSKWLEVIAKPSIVLVMGKRGSGKSGLGYRLLELFRYTLTPYVVGIPKQSKRLLPDWIGTAQDLNDVPPGSIVLVDEAYLLYHSRGSLKAQSRVMSQLVNLSRQRNQTLVFVTPEARQIDKNITSQADVVIFKELGIMQLKFDRPEINDIARQAKQAFNNISGDKRKWSYVYSPDTNFMGLLDNALPSFWSVKLSHAFVTNEPSCTHRIAKGLTIEEKKAKAKELRQSSLSYRKIGNMLGVNESTAYNYVNDYPYKRKPD